MARSGLTIDVTDVDTSAKLPLGFIHVEPASSVGTYADMGERHWIYVFNDDAATNWVQGDVIIRDAGTATYDGARGSAVASARVIGVAQHAIAFGSYGFILRKGVGEVKGDGGDDQENAALIAAASGRCSAAGAITDDAFGIGTESDGAVADALITAIIDCSG